MQSTGLMSVALIAVIIGLSADRDHPAAHATQTAAHADPDAIPHALRAQYLEARPTPAPQPRPRLTARFGDAALTATLQSGHAPVGPFTLWAPGAGDAAQTARLYDAHAPIGAFPLGAPSFGDAAQGGDAQDRHALVGPYERPGPEADFAGVNAVLIAQAAAERQAAMSRRLASAEWEFGGVANNGFGRLPAPADEFAGLGHTPDVGDPSYDFAGLDAVFTAPFIDRDEIWMTAWSASAADIEVLTDVIDAAP